MVSTTHDTYKDPNKRDNPTFRQTEKFLQTNKKFTLTSGFGQNHDPFDGKGFKPLPVLDGTPRLTQVAETSPSTETTTTSRNPSTATQPSPKPEPSRRRATTSELID